MRLARELKRKSPEEEQVFFNHITVQEIDDLDADIEVVEELETLEDGG